MQHAIKFQRPSAGREPDLHRAWLDEFMRSGVGAPLEMPLVEEVYSIKPTRSEKRTIVEYSERVKDKSWYVITVGTWREVAVQEELERSRIVTYLPVVSKTIVRRKKRTTVTVPWLRRYLFVALDAEEPPFGVVRAARGVIDFIGCDGEPERIPGGHIEAIVRREAMGKLEAVQRLPCASDWMAVGARGRIKDGPFASFIAEIIDLREKHVVVETDIFGRPTPIELELAQLGKV